MEKSNYFKSLVSLFESIKINEQELDQKQEKIADRGSDVIDKSIDQKEIPEDPDDSVLESDEEGNTEFPEEDLAYLQDSQSERTNEIISDVSEEKKLLRLYELFKNLLNYGKRFKKNLEIIENDLLEKDEQKELKDYMKRVEKEVQKIEDYFENSFSSTKYEKSLYLYILLRTEFLTIVDGLRVILKLNEKE